MRFYVKCRDSKGKVVNMIAKGKNEEEAKENLHKVCKSKVEVIEISTKRFLNNNTVRSSLIISNRNEYQRNRSREGAY